MIEMLIIQFTLKRKLTLHNNLKFSSIRFVCVFSGTTLNLLCYCFLQGRKTVQKISNMLILLHYFFTTTVKKQRNLVDFTIVYGFIDILLIAWQRIILTLFRTKYHGDRN